MQDVENVKTPPHNGDGCVNVVTSNAYSIRQSQCYL